MAIDYEKKIKNQVKTLYFKMDSDVLTAIMAEFKDLQKMIEHLKSIDVTGVEPMTRNDETPISNLRTDVPKVNSDYYLFLKNAPEIENDYIVINNDMENIVDND